jgi:hypothetical protein
MAGIPTFDLETKLTEFRVQWLVCIPPALTLRKLYTYTMLCVYVLDMTPRMNGYWFPKQNALTRWSVKWKGRVFMRCTALGLTQPLLEMSTRKPFWGDEARLGRKVDNLAAISKPTV